MPRSPTVKPVPVTVHGEGVRLQYYLMSALRGVNPLTLVGGENRVDIGRAPSARVFIRPESRLLTRYSVKVCVE